MKKDLYDIDELDLKINNKLGCMGEASAASCINEVKSIKNDMYEKASKIFVYNLKRLIQLEGTQKNLAKKIGISEDLLSKYKSEEAFPSIETLLYICQVYQISMDKLINVPLASADIEFLGTNQLIDSEIFEDKYYVYFFVTNIAKNGAIHEGIVTFTEDKVTFKILSKDKAVKWFDGNYTLSDKLIFFNLHSQSDGNVYISMLKPNVNKGKYVGGISLLSLPSDANSKPCFQKILFSKVSLDRKLYSDKLKELLNFHVEASSFGNLKISPAEDEAAYNFIESLRKKPE
ncbi:helix-turn-helix transcriptional regulator [Clostridium sp. 19966]|uniref:helix-turn-helix domain-containing protein n=1 Tax=Clostridium sp. 19966 TaxID=2768166 RepID=UPI0028DF4408|nr:helix-turn-helix transcriptional regulator [Clostridium sp. 19966]MDT8719438.1 helix-turn-helix transcriptional regulator [Clostridium sp. 19966]